MKFFDAIIQFDQRVFGRIEKFCHKTQRTIGWTNFTLLRLVSMLFGCSVGITATLLGTSQYTPFSEKLLMVLLYTFALGGLGFWAATVMKKHSEWLCTRGLANPLKEIFVAVTLCRMLFIVLSLLFWQMSAAIFLGVIALYLMQCDPLPPCDSKLKQWFQSLFLTQIPIRTDDQ
ncbi:MAG: hypothetical protein Q7S52_03945 [bacterium]|nr:hypothetical protein [bacterium]